MQYKTIILELLQERPTLYEALRGNKRLLPAIDQYAIELKACHETWKTRIARTGSPTHPLQIASLAMEMALEEFEQRLPSESANGEEEPFCLDEAMRFISRPMSHA